MLLPKPIANIGCHILLPPLLLPNLATSATIENMSKHDIREYIQGSLTNSYGDYKGTLGGDGCSKASLKR